MATKPNGKSPKKKDPKVIGLKVEKTKGYKELPKVEVPTNAQFIVLYMSELILMNKKFQRHFDKPFERGKAMINMSNLPAILDDMNDHPPMGYVLWGMASDAFIFKLKAN